MRSYLKYRDRKFYKRIITNPLPLLFILGSVGLVHLSSFMVFHVVSEIFTIFIAGFIFVIGWNSKSLSENYYLVWIGVAHFFIALLDTGHLLLYKGMPLEMADANIATQFWISARLFQGAAFLTGFAFIRKRINSHLLFFVFAGIAGLMALSMFQWNIFPRLFSEEKGLALIKIVMEWVIILLFAASLFMIYKKQKLFRGILSYYIKLSLIFLILTEIAFTAYKNVTSEVMIAGHILKVLAYYFLYKTFIQEAIIHPYKILFQNFRFLKNFEKDMRKELELAERIQAQLLPKDAPVFEKVRFSSLYKPMARVGGDFYTYIPLNEDNIGILISDIVGHGVPAALVTAMMKAIIDISGNFIDSPQYLMTFLNEKLLQVQNGERFLTAFYGIYNRRTGYLTYTRCGHPYPFIIRGEELIEVKGNRGNPVLGLFHESAFHEDFIHLVPGDKILFYTDGLIEALSPEGQPFEEHLEKVLKVNSHLPIEKLIDRVYYYLLLHCEKDMFEDDVCMVGMELEI